MEKNRLYFQVMLGALLGYQGFKLMKDVLSVRPEHYVIYAAAGAVFLIVGFIWGGLGVKNIVKYERGEKSKRNEEDDGILETHQDSESEE